MFLIFSCQSYHNISQTFIGRNNANHINILDNKINLITNNIKKLNNTCESILSQSLKLGIKPSYKTYSEVLSTSMPLLEKSISKDLSTSNNVNNSFLI